MFEQLNRVKKVQEGFPGGVSRRVFQEGSPGGVYRRRFEKGSHEGFPSSEDGFQGIGVVLVPGNIPFQEVLQKVFHEGPQDGFQARGFQKVPQGSYRCQKVPDDSKMFRKVQKGTSRFQKIPGRSGAVEDFCRTHYERLWPCFCSIVQISPDQPVEVMQTASMPLVLGGLGLRLAWRPG